MNTSKNLIADYYFVPLGIEPGSFLDILGLPPTASEVEATQKESVYLKQLERNFKNRRKELRGKRDQKEITEEEFDDSVKKLEEEKRENEINIGNLKEKYKLELAEKRKLKHLGLKDDSAIWLEMWESFSHVSEAHCLEKFIFKKHSFPQIKALKPTRIAPSDNYRNPDINKHINTYSIESEPGSFLDILGLAPTASEFEVKKKESEYLFQLDFNFKNERKELKGKRDMKKITQDEFNSRMKKLEKEREEKETNISILKRKYNEKKTEKPGLENKGLKDDTTIWVGNITSPDNYGNSHINKYINTILKNFHNGFDTMALSLLLRTDELWSKLEYTYLEFWINEIEKWDKELDAFTPRLNITAVEDKNYFYEPDFPTLCQPINLTIEQINDEAVENLFNMPERKGELKSISLSELLAKILARNKTTAGEKPEDMVGENSEPVSIEHLFMDLLKDLLFNSGDKNKYNI